MCGLCTVIIHIFFLVVVELLCFIHSHTSKLAFSEVPWRRVLSAYWTLDSVCTLFLKLSKVSSFCYSYSGSFQISVWETLHQEEFRVLNSTAASCCLLCFFIRFQQRASLSRVGPTCAGAGVAASASAGARGPAGILRNGARLRNKAVAFKMTIIRWGVLQAAFPPALLHCLLPTAAVRLPPRNTTRDHATFTAAAT